MKLGQLIFSCAALVAPMAQAAAVDVLASLKGSDRVVLDPGDLVYFCI